VRKVKQIKEKEGKDSLFKEIKFKSQAAMEYLMTYGWAILIIALALGVLYSLGIMNPKNFLPRAPPGSCFVFRPNGPGTTDFVSLQGTCGYLPMYVGSFNGVNSYVRVENFPSSPSVTIMLWVLFENSADVPVSKISDSNASGTQTFNFYYDPNQVLRATIWTADGTGHEISMGVQPMRKWLFVAETFDGSTYTHSAYLNGALINSRSYTLGIRQVIAPLNIGRWWAGDPKWHTGLIANVQIYNTALTPQEIQYLYQQGLGGGPVRLQNLVAWWPLNGDAKDYSGNNNHGTIYGGVTFVQNYNPP
jgi:hypothetical protein